MKSKVSKDSKPKLRTVLSLDDSFEILLDEKNDPWLRIEKQKPKRVSFAEALRQYIKRWPDHRDGNYGEDEDMGKFYNLIADKLQTADRNDSDENLMAIEVLAVSKRVTIEVPVTLPAEKWIALQMESNAVKQPIGQVLSQLIVCSDDLTELCNEKWSEAEKNLN